LQIDFGIKNEEKIDIDVTDVNGQSKIQVKQHQLTQKCTLDMRHLPNGIYFIVVTKNDQKFAKRFFKATD
jgi:Secretion system C-terminal sorting domain